MQRITPAGPLRRAERGALRACARLALAPPARRRGPPLTVQQVLAAPPVCRPLPARHSFFAAPLLRTSSSISHAPSGRLTAAAAPQSAQGVAPEEIQWNDVVEYLLPRPLGGATLGLGRVEALEADAGRVTLAPLELEPDDEEWWAESHDAQPQVLPAACVVRILEVEFSQRQDREGNPHGEHAHDVYRLLSPAAPDVYRGPHTLPVVLRAPGGEVAAS
ncbi:hypothetical protein HYH02_005045 [Chlamydomonas schloesseri]|uniref:Uncharacterized protein n=1 Tax=Chlamydomonas schloesseri TaxID=2026947 RepID=A0A835WNL2_9CHLO|nr:hypothetical protein HYH02_005045 [Chlamydomonas schloesseri]|eukprot:KAG2450544.1 hypothetical protein HYH02_005045 [Chlamydomonas schloesseri]